MPSPLNVFPCSVTKKLVLFPARLVMIYPCAMHRCMKLLHNLVQVDGHGALYRLEALAQVLCEALLPPFSQIAASLVLPLRSAITLTCPVKGA